MKRVFFVLFVFPFFISCFGCYDFSGKLDQRREGLLNKCRDLEKEVARHSKQFDRRERLRNESRILDKQIELIQDIIKKEKKKK